MRRKCKDSLAHTKVQVYACMMEHLPSAGSTHEAVSRLVDAHKNTLRFVGFAFAALVLGLLLVMGHSTVVYATAPGDAMFAAASTALTNVLRLIRNISSIVAGLFLTIAFVIKMVSKNQRSVDEANTWIKRIFIAWACINAVGFLLTFVQEIIGPDVALPTIP